ncbi:MAG: phosphatidate cytidylyltransferase [Gammaproteobacteria bacterium]|nr:phosphatidate cytidylyltransferase [Gammaproteobacteria bacterium]
MLRVRVATGAILAVVVVAVVVLLPLAWMAAFFHLVLLVAAYEWAKLCGVETRLGFVAYAAVLSAAVALFWLFPAAWMPGLLVAVVFWLVATGVVVSYPTSAPLLRATPVALAGGVVALGGAWLALVVLKAATGSHGDSAGAWHIVWLLAAVALADTGAYFTGHQFGRRKLAPRVSPGKTVEGALGGAAAVLAWSACAAVLFDGPVVGWLLLGVAIVAAAVVGDLFESALKRMRGVKDSGGILPGHGGILDRIDSVLPTAPVFALLIT